MSEDVLAVLSVIRTVDDMTKAFSDEERCRRLVEAMVWPNGRICPACGYKRSIAIAGRDMGKRRARPGLYQCSNGDCLDSNSKCNTCYLSRWHGNPLQTS